LTPASSFIRSLTWTFSSERTASFICLSIPIVGAAGRQRVELLDFFFPCERARSQARGRAAQKQRFLGEFFPAELPEGATGRAFVDFFQVNKMSGETKGILAIRLGRSRRK
jgi:hypothetical protein